MYCTSHACLDGLCTTFLFLQVNFDDIKTGMSLSVPGGEGIIIIVVCDVQN